MLSHQEYKCLTSLIHQCVVGRGDWSPEGCMNMGSNENGVMCACSHLTSFAVLNVSPLYCMLDCLEDTCE